MSTPTPLEKFEINLGCLKAAAVAEFLNLPVKVPHYACYACQTARGRGWGGGARNRDIKELVVERAFAAPRDFGSFGSVMSYLSEAAFISPAYGWRKPSETFRDFPAGQLARYAMLRDEA